MEHTKSANAVEKHIMAVVRENKSFLTEISGAAEIIANNNKKFHTFRIVVSLENKPAAVDERLRIEAEKYISRISGLKVNRTLPDTEFWFLFRREESRQGLLKERDFSIFMKRLTMHPSKEKALHKGELPPALAWTMCRTARLVHSDTVLDPFCGYGSIPDAAFKHFHITKFIACDSNSEAASYTAARFKKHEKFSLYRTDFSELPSLTGEKTIDAIVTDPPWGQYRKIDNSFHEKMFSVFEKVLKDEGRAVVLYANDKAFLNALPKNFQLQDNIPILLSGKKAAIIKLRMRG